MKQDQEKFKTTQMLKTMYSCLNIWKIYQLWIEILDIIGDRKLFIGNHVQNL